MSEISREFAAKVNMYYKLSQDKAYVEAKRIEQKKAEDALNEARKLQMLKLEILKAAEEGDNRYRHDIKHYDNKWTADFLKEQLGLDVVEKRESGSCGGHGYGSYEIHCFEISWGD